MIEMQKAPWSDWETVRLIGRGSFGTVYEIQRKLIDDNTESAALKVITIPQNPGDIEELYSEGYDDESITAAFNSHLKSIIAEYSLMRKMDGSANIVNCKDIRYIQHDDGIGWDIYIRMELLTPLMKALPVDASEDAVIKIGKDICNALVLCKKHEIVHRDIKPQNIFISANGDYKLGDFGIAKTVEKTMGGTKIGTYKYMAPEVYNNQPYGSAADIYSLGLVLYWLLNERRMPFMPLPPVKLGAGMDEEARHRRLSGEKLPAPAHGSDELKRIVLKACAYDPKDRYTSAAAMLEDLNSLGGVAAPVAPAVVAGNYTETYEDDKTTGPVFINTTKASDAVAVDNDPTDGPSFEKKIAPPKESAEEDSYSTADKIEGNSRKRKRYIIGMCTLFFVILCAAVILFWPWYSEWSEWSTVIPKDMDGRKVQSMEQYRYREKVLVESEQGSFEGGILVSQREERSDFGEWSEWQTDFVQADNNCKVESQIQYRSRKKTTTENWSEWSSWSNWSTTSANASESCEVKTRTVYSYDVYRYHCNHCGMSFGSLNVNMVVHAAKNGVHDEAVEKLSEVIIGDQPGNELLMQILNDAGYTYQRKVLYGIDTKLAVDTSSNPYQLNEDGSVWYTSSTEPSKTERQYSARTRKLIETEGWSDWSDYTSEQLQADQNTEIEQRTVYRFCTRENVTIYTFEIWDEWSAWENESMQPAANLEQELRKVYRYADRFTLWDKLVNSTE